jgi:hypothetical protein
MNVVKKIFENLTDVELRDLIMEIKKFKETGFIETNSPLRTKIEQVIELTGNNYATEIIGVSYTILELGAFKFVDFLDKETY